MLENCEKRLDNACCDDDIHNKTHRFFTGYTGCKAEDAEIAEQCEQTLISSDLARKCGVDDLGCGVPAENNAVIRSERPYRHKDDESEYLVFFERKASLYHCDEEEKYAGKSREVQSCTHKCRRSVHAVNEEARYLRHDDAGCEQSRYPVLERFLPHIQDKV